MPDAKTSAGREDQVESGRDSTSLAINAARVTLYLSNHRPADRFYVAIASVRIALHKEPRISVEFAPARVLQPNFDPHVEHARLLATRL